MKPLKLFFFLTPLVLPAITLSSCSSYLDFKWPHDYPYEGQKVDVYLNQPRIVVKGKVIQVSAVGIVVEVKNSTLADGNYLFTWSNIEKVV